MRVVWIVLLCAACRIPDVTFIKGDGGTGDGGSDCKPGLGFPSVPWPVIPGVRTIALGDVDNDGITDLVAATGVSGSYAIHVLHGRGDGTFEPSFDLPLTSSPSAIALAKVDTDGTLDIVTANDNNTVSVLLNHNDAPGTFSVLASLPTGANPVAIAVADFNNDGYGDLVTADADAGTVSVLLSGGGGTYAGAKPYAVGPNPAAVAIGDFNGNGPDIAVVISRVGVQPGAAEVLLGDGAGSFGTVVPAGDVGKQPTGLVVVDLDGDGHRDLVISNAIDNSISRIYGDGAGGFTTPVSNVLIAAPRSIAVGQVDDDGRLDLVVAGSDGISVLLASGARTFGAPHAQLAGLGPVVVAVAPIGATPAPGLIATANRGDDSATIWLARPDGSLIAPASYTVGLTPGFAIAADLHGTGKLDVVTSNGSAGSVSVLANPGNGMLAAKSDITLVDDVSTSLPSAIAGVDLDGDGHVDVVAVDTSLAAVHLLFGDGAGNLARGVPISLAAPARAIALGDVNGDGAPDLVVAETTGHALSVILGNHTRAPEQRPEIPLDPDSLPVGLALLDIDGIGAIDFAVADAGRHEIKLMLGDGHGGVLSSSVIPLGASTPTGLAAGPLHAGGAADLVVTVDAPVPRLLVFRHLAAGGFGPAEPYAAGAAPQSPVIADLTHDGIPDVLYTGRNGSTVSVLAGLSGDMLAPEVDYGVGGTPGGFVAADVTGDGVLDLVIPHGAASVSVLAAICLP